MTRSTARTVAIAVLCLLVIAASAATLPSLESGGTGEISGTPESGGDPDGDDASGEGDSDEERIDGEYGGMGGVETTCVQAFVPQSVLGALALVGLAVAGVTVRRLGARTTLLLALALAPLIVGVWVALTADCGATEPPVEDAGEGGAAGAEASDEPSGPDEGDVDVPAIAVPSLALLSVVLLAVLGAVGALFYAGGDSREHRDEPRDVRDDAERRAELGRAAGRAADRIESADEFENEVYRAWREMTDPLPVNRPASSTPGEFAAAARDAGLDEDDVAELTELFQAVRYGDRPVTAERESRAVAALRRIEESGGDRRE